MLVVDLGLVDHHVAVGVRGDGKVTLPDLLTDPRPRQAMSGGFSDVIRRAAGRATPELESELERAPVGDVGVGRGGAATSPKSAHSNAALNDAIRKTARRVQGRVELDDPVDFNDLMGGK